MLTIYSSSNADSAIGYYLAELSRSRYYGAGLWLGKDAARLGLEGKAVEKKAFALLCKNKRPDTGEKLNPRNDVTRRPGTDFTWSCPKSVSLAAIVLNDKRIFEAFRESVREAMSYIEMEAHVRVRGGGLVDVEKTSSLLWSEHLHIETRPHDDGLTSPQLHVHCYVQNTSFSKAENRFKAAELFPVVRDANFYQNIFLSRLAEALKKLGYEIENKPFSFEIAGIGDENIKRFSKRTQEIEALSRRLGVFGNPAAVAKLGAISRNSKKAVLEGVDKEAEWKERFDWDELNLENPQRKQPAITASEAVNLAIENQFERRSVVGLRRLIADGLQKAIGDASLEEIIAEFRGKQDLVVRKINGVTYATTKEILAEERSILSFLKRTRSSEIPMLGWYRETSEELDDDQKAAVEAIMRTRDRAIFVSGRAGSGKTKMLTRLVESMTDVGVQAHLFAPSSSAAHVVLKSEGFADSETVQQLLVNPKLQKEIHGKVLIVDEAGLLGSKDFKRLFEIAEEQNARVVCLGDAAQHHSVQRGAAFRMCCESGLVTVKETRTVYRQRNAKYKRAVTALSVGDAEQALDILDEMGAIKEVADFDERLEATAQEYVDSLAEFRGRVLAVSPTHLEGHLLTNRIRALMREHGTLEEKETDIAVHRNRNLTEAEQKLSAFYREGDVVRFHQNAKGGFTKSDIAKVVEKNENGIFVRKIGEEKLRRLDFDSAQHFSVFNETSIAVSIGDKVRVTRNTTTDTGKRLYNGNVHVITAITDDGVICLDDEHQVPPDSGLLNFGYVSSSHASQGMTSDKVIISQSSMSFDASSLEQFYVSVSRGRNAISLFTDNREGLFDTVRDPSRRMLALEVEARRVEEEEEMLIDENVSQEIQLL